MTAYTVSPPDTTYGNTLTANSADTVTFTNQRFGYVSITNAGSAVIYARADGQTAVAAAEGTVMVLPNTTAVLANGLPLWYQSSNAIVPGTSEIPFGNGATEAASSTVTSSPAQPGETQPFMASGAGHASNPGTVVSIISTAADPYLIAGTG
jgi:hypothetical protein